MYALVNGKIIYNDKVLNNHAVIIQGNTIKDIIPTKDIPGSLTKVDVLNSYIAPGFIDLQLNGCGGVLFNDDISLATIQTMHQTNLQSGCTSFLPTLITAEAHDIETALAVVQTAYQEMANNVLGIHIEGPFINQQKKGIHNQKFVRNLSSREADILQKAAANLPMMLTLAPETNNLNLIRSLRETGIMISLGHSNASYQEAMNAIELGVNHATHLFNAMTALNHRAPGMVTAILNSPEVYTGMIMDGIHVDFNLIKLVKRLKPEHLYIVTDAIPPVGVKGQTQFIFGGQEVKIVDGKAINHDGTLGGAYITMIESVRNASEIIGLGVVEAVRMASLYPAKVMGCHSHLGLIKKGYIANLAIFDNDYRMLYTVSNGELITLS